MHVFIFIMVESCYINLIEMIDLNGSIKSSLELVPLRQRTFLSLSGKNILQCQRFHGAKQKVGITYFRFDYFLFTIVYLDIQHLP